MPHCLPSIPIRRYWEYSLGLPFPLEFIAVDPSSAYMLAFLCTNPTCVLRAVRATDGLGSSASKNRECAGPSLK